MRRTSDSCPHCHAPAPTEPVSTTRFRAWLLCLSCGHAWSVSRIWVALRSCTHRPPEAITPPSAAEDDSAAMDAAEAALLGRTHETDAALESWFDGVGSSSTARQAWNSVDAWLDSDPLPVVAAARDRAVEDEWGLTRRPEAARPTPKTLMERLDALYQGMLQLERFVEKSAKMDEAIAAASAPAEPPAAPPRPRPCLVPRPEGRPHEPAAA